MRCSNCGASIPRSAGTCPECGVFARVVTPPRSNTRIWILALLLIAIGVAAFTYLSTKPSARPVARPLLQTGPVRNQAEAMLRLRQSFGVSPDCVAVISKGFSDGSYHLDAVNRCDGTRLGRWRVEGKTGHVRRE